MKEKIQNILTKIRKFKVWYYVSNWLPTVTIFGFFGWLNGVFLYSMLREIGVYFRHQEMFPLVIISLLGFILSVLYMVLGSKKVSHLILKHSELFLLSMFFVAFWGLVFLMMVFGGVFPR